MTHFFQLKILISAITFFAASGFLRILDMLFSATCGSIGVNAACIYFFSTSEPNYTRLITNHAKSDITQVGSDDLTAWQAGAPFQLWLGGGAAAQGMTFFYRNIPTKMHFLP